jgi:hypothetical protein
MEVNVHDANFELSHPLSAAHLKALSLCLAIAVEVFRARGRRGWASPGRKCSDGGKVRR